MNFANEDLLSILNALASKLDLRIFADKGVKGKMSVNAKDVTLRDVLKNLLLQRNYQYTLKGRDLTVISLKNDDSSRVAKELLFKDLSLKDALQTVSKIMNINLILHESVEDKKVNFYVENLNLDELLDVLIDTNGLVKKPHNENTFIICSKESAGDFEKKQYKTFKLVNAKPEEIINMINKSKSLSERIKTENFSVNDRINSISVYDSPENLSLIAKIIEGADEKVQQIVIEVKLIEVNPASAKKLGLSFSENSTKVFDGNKLPENNIGEKDLSITAVLDLLEREKKVKLISSPKIRTVHGKSASISIGKVYPVPSYKYENASNSYLGHIPQIYKEYRDLEVGIKLEVTPEISRDNEISMDLKTVVEDVVGEANEDGQYKRLQRTTSSHVRVKNGETVVVGGLISANDDVAKQSSSLFNRIHLFKNMTTRNNATAQRGEVIMLVTPRLVNLDGDDDDCADDIDDVSEGVY